MVKPLGVVSSYGGSIGQYLTLVPRDRPDAP
jgi:hypothetical protein